jgi:general secretion pathway protein F
VETYVYEAATKEGRVVAGTMEASSERLAVDRLQEMGYFPIRLNTGGTSGGFASRLRALSGSRIKETDIMSFSYQLGALLEAGFPLDKCLSVLSELTGNKALREIIGEIHSHVRGGKSLSDALAMHPSVFPAFYTHMIRAGETGGVLEETVARLARYLEGTRKIKEEVRSALIYPAVLAAVGGMAVAALLLFVVPKFSRIFSEMGQALPLPTALLLSLSTGLREYWWALFLLLLGGVVSLRQFFRSASGRRHWDQWRYRLPLLGKVFQEVTVSRFVRTLGTLLQSGVSILHALDAVKGTLGSDRMAEVVSSVREAVRKGREVSGPLRDSGMFPAIVVHMIAVGEQTGKLDEMLLKIADRSDEDLRMTIKRFLSLLEPALILLMGLIVGAVVIAMLWAIFSLNELPI